MSGCLSLNLLLSYSIGDLLLEHLEFSIRVDDLVSERTCWEVGLLRDVEEIVDRGRAERAGEERPESSENPEKRWLSAAIRTSHNHVVPVFNVQRNRSHQFLAARRHNRNVLEDNLVFGLVNLNKRVAIFEWVRDIFERRTSPCWIWTSCGALIYLKPNSSDDDTIICLLYWPAKKVGEEASGVSVIGW